mmetsp:Transcript_38383/g.114972  ORF Transcript_38383/g.114972 Transcript_38383/m.114972 type:complete len:290 (-) Transcript_38383:609-1478(-)
MRRRPYHGRIVVPIVVPRPGLIGPKQGRRVPIRAVSVAPHQVPHDGRRDAAQYKVRRQRAGPARRPVLVGVAAGFLRGPHGQAELATGVETMRMIIRGIMQADGAYGVQILRIGCQLVAHLERPVLRDDPRFVEPLVVERTSKQCRVRPLPPFGRPPFVPQAEEVYAYAVRVSGALEPFEDVTDGEFRILERVRVVVVVAGIRIIFVRPAGEFPRESVQENVRVALLRLPEKPPLVSAGAVQVVGGVHVAGFGPVGRLAVASDFDLPASACIRIVARTHTHTGSMIERL